ncbi:hypothetical protein T01_15668 [Trichinella spiralis]|uniref:Uncharacterized protein n=1 Tax=Trichinella spiralis TaxID=6334 RepID=A0A0V1AJ90_TRISP|nr:hypothetical protein T01_15668 [Trichinella spiralis]
MEIVELGMKAHILEDNLLCFFSYSMMIKGAFSVQLRQTPNRGNKPPFPPVQKIPPARTAVGFWRPTRMTRRAGA